MTTLPPCARAAARSLCLLAAAALVFSSCGGGPSPAGTPTAPPAPPPAPAPQAPAAPTNLRVTDRGDHFIQWAWSAAPGAAGYQVEISVGDDNFSPPDEQAFLAANQTAVRFEDPELGPGTVVYLRVRAFSGSQAAPTYGPYSAAVSGATLGTPPTPSGDDSERERLVALYLATGGEDWQNNDNWLSDRPLDEWFGVDTDADGNVTGLALGSNGLDGELPADLGGLGRLQAVDLGDNRLRGAIPPEVGRLTAIRTVDLSGNLLTGGIPHDLAEWSQLRELDLGDNRLSGVIPPALGSGGGVRRLNLGNNRLTGEIPHDLAEWGQLEELDLGDNELSGDIPRQLGGGSRLRSVDLGGNRLTGVVPDPSGEWSDHLEHFDLGDNELTGGIPSSLGGAGRLTGLDLGGNRLTGVIPPSLGGASRLTGLDLGNNRLTGTIPPQLGNLSELVELDLGNEEELLPAGVPGWAAQTTGPEPGNALTGPIPPELGRLTRLEGLDLSGNELSGGIPQEFANLTSLETLNLANNTGLSGVLHEALTALTALVKLALEGTALTVPDTAAFRDWLENIPSVSGVDELAEPEPAGDRAVLEAFYRATNGDNWSNNSGWLSEAPLRDWYGVLTDANGRVTSLVLRRNQLSGVIPPELGQLAHLNQLLLNDNQLSGTIPPELGQLTNLNHLSLDVNQLSGPLPDTFLALTRLELLGMRETDLCVPSGARFDRWLESIRSFQGVRCEPEPAGDRAVLAAFYRATNGDNWSNNSGWLSEAPLGDWHGVVTDANGRVTCTGPRPERVERADSARTRPAPPDVAMDLNHNQLSGAIPRELGQLSNLRSAPAGATS